ncbi:YihY/virulence factor BrkB family protein [Paractinoplanes toevensis]|nr:YhjD/YihY/BrkB family envelope integrity protein [Actinoplanes toevensis]
MGRPLMRGVGELLRVQIFDRSMTLAAQAFTSIFPLLIMLSALGGTEYRDRLSDLMTLPDASEQLLHQAVSGSRSNAFGLVGCLIVVLSATGLSRAMIRAYRDVWSIKTRPAGPAATAGQVGAVLALVVFVFAARLLGWLAGMLPAPRLGQAVAYLLADCATAILVPWLLLGKRAPRAPLLFGGAAFGLIMLAVRAAGSVYLPRALQSSADRYGTIGLAFTFVGWLYVLSFCLLLSAVVGGVLAGLRSDRPAQVQGGSHLAEAGDETANPGPQHQRAQGEAGREPQDRTGQRPPHPEER